MKKAWVYILLCSDNSYYTGSTTALEQRLADHQSGRYCGYTSRRLPVRFLWSEEFEDIRDATALERKVKKWTRAKKEALMRGDFKMLQLLSQSTKTKLKLGHKEV